MHKHKLNYASLMQNRNQVNLHSSRQNEEIFVVYYNIKNTILTNKMNIVRCCLKVSNINKILAVKILFEYLKLGAPFL